MSVEFFLTSIVVILLPGTGVIYTIAIGLGRGFRPSIAAAFGCTLGILPAAIASIIGLAAVLHTSALAFQVVKYIGDDVVALFPDVPRAIEASAEIIQETRTEGVSRGPGTGFQVAIGIGYGPTLHVPDLDVWGAEANAAFKLGEDTAGPGQIMITSAAHEGLSEEQRSGFEVMHLQISGLSLEAYFKTP